MPSGSVGTLDLSQREWECEGSATGRYRPRMVRRIIRLSGIQPVGTKGRVDLRLDASRRQSREPRLRSARFDLVAELVAPFPDVWFCRRHDCKLNTAMDHEGPLYRTSGNQLLLRIQSIRANTGVDQLMGVVSDVLANRPYFEGSAIVADRGSAKASEASLRGPVRNCRHIQPTRHVFQHVLSTVPPQWLNALNTQQFLYFLSLVVARKAGRRPT